MSAWRLGSWRAGSWRAKAWRGCDVETPQPPVHVYSTGASGGGVEKWWRESRFEDEIDRIVADLYRKPAPPVVITPKVVLEQVEREDFGKPLSPELLAGLQQYLRKEQRRREEEDFIVQLALSHGLI